jgi:Mrp family chromosome partitioning ATPase
VLLIDANFYRPGLGHSYKNLPTSGLGELISGKVRLEDIVVASEDLPTLHLMGPGILPAVKVSELMESRAFRDIVLPLLKSKYDLVIFDGAPMNLVSDSIALGAKVDGVIAVVRAGAISKGMVARVRDQLKQVHANLVGLVLNAAQIQSAGYFRENYRTFYKYAGPSSQRRTDVTPVGPDEADRV